jgi:HEAT repeat protein
VGAAAAEALGSIGDARAVKPLCRAFVEEKASYNYPVRGSALMALVRFGAPAAEALVEALEEADQHDRREARKDLAILTRGVYDVAVRIFADQVAAKFDAKEKADSSEL